MFDSLWPHGLYSPWNSPGHNTEVCSHSLLQEIFPTQGLNPGLSHCRWILYHLSHQGSPRILEWMAYPFSRVTSWPSNQTGVPCIAGGFFISSAIREVHCIGFIHAHTHTHTHTHLCIPHIYLLYISESLCSTPQTQHCKSTILQLKAKKKSLIDSNWWVKSLLTFCIFILECFK